MTNPTLQEPPGHAEGDGPLPTTPSPTPHTSPDQEASAANATVVPSQRTSEPHPPVEEGSSSPTGLWDLLWKLSGDNRRATWCFIFTVTFLGTSVVLVWLMAPFLGGAVASLLGAIGGGTAVGAVQGTRKAVRARRAKTK